jgi:hypothetical protein
LLVRAATVLQESARTWHIGRIAVYSPREEEVRRSKPEEVKKPLSLR